MYGTDENGDLIIAKVGPFSCRPITDWPLPEPLAAITQDELVKHAYTHGIGQQTPESINELATLQAENAQLREALHWSLAQFKYLANRDNSGRFVCDMIGKEGVEYLSKFL